MPLSVYIMLELSHQIGLIFLINALCVSLIIRNRNNELNLALSAFIMGLVCYNMQSIDRAQLFQSQFLILGICVPCIVYIGAAVILLYVRVIRKLRLLKKLQVRFEKKDLVKKQS